MKVAAMALRIPVYSAAAFLLLILSIPVAHLSVNESTLMCPRQGPLPIHIHLVYT